MFGLTLIFLLAVMGGAIAYIGDKIGMKIGKKRLTILGLRPKHTSILITILTGILIAAFTLLLLAAVSQDVRTALFGMKALKKELVKLSSAVEEKNTLLVSTRNSLKFKTVALAAKEKEYSKLNQQVAEKTSQLNNLEKELKSVIAQRNEQSMKIKALSEQYREINQKLASAHGDIEKLQKTKNQLAVKIADLEQNKEKLSLEVAQKEELAKQLRLGLEVVREGNIALRASEEMASGIIQGNKSKEKIQEQLTDLIVKANQLALQRGAKPTIEGEGAVWLSQNELDEVMKILTSTDKAVVVRLLCSANTIQGEPVVANFQLFESKQIFHKGEVVLEDKIDGTQPDSIIEAQLIGLLQKVNQEAVKKGMIPDPLRGTVGTVQALEIYNTVKKVKDIGQGKVDVSVVSINDVSVGDSLAIKFQVKK